MLQRLKQQWRAWQDRRFLKRHGCDSWAEYHRVYDPDYNCRADRVNDFYHGYPHVYCFDDQRHYVYHLIADYGPGGCRWGHGVIHDWVNQNSQDKARFDFLRVHKQGAVDWDGSVTEEWLINGICGQDLIFVAFKNEQDYLHFLLRWS